VTTDGLRTLLVVQERDTEADQIRHRRSHLPERARLDAITAELTAVETEGATVSAQRDELLKRQAELEAELADTEKRHADVDRQMRSGVISAARDLQAMAGQIESLKRRKSTLEDTELEVMEEIEPLDARVASLQSRWAALDEEAGGLREVVAAAEVVLDAELEAVLAQRAEAADGLPADLLATYERLRARLGGVGAASLVGSSCGGCHLTLSASEVDRVRRQPPDAIVTCDQCGRILVR
jgi:predicted  nucleic acid-binding Zn-ribbon protein